MILCRANFYLENFHRFYGFVMTVAMTDFGYVKVLNLRKNLRTINFVRTVVTVLQITKKLLNKHFIPHSQHLDTLGVIFILFMEVTP